MVATATYNNEWPTPQQVRSTVRYPVDGIASIVTYVGIVVDQVIHTLRPKKIIFGEALHFLKLFFISFASQSSDQGQAYVISGGINQRSIAFVIEATDTLYFKYNAEIYAYN